MWNAVNLLILNEGSYHHIFPALVLVFICVVLFCFCSSSRPVHLVHAPPPPPR